MWESQNPFQWLKDIKENPDKHPKFLAFQNELPRLPVPDLQQSLTKYLDVVKPVLSEDEFKTTLAVVEEFGKGQGRVLQQRLLEHEENCKKNGVTNWLKDWWLIAAYHSDPTPIPVNSNVFAVVRDHPLAVIQKIDPIIRGAAFANHTAVYRSLVENQTIPIDHQGKQKLCMDQYTRVLSTVRIPGVQCDHLVTYPFEKSLHLVVLIREHFFSVDLFENNLPRSAASILHDLEDIFAHASNLPEATPISTFTYEERPFWAKARQKLIEHSATNRATFEAIDSSIAVMVFDENEPSTNDESARLALNGEGRLRWFDKSCQFIIFRNGRVGNNAEHSPFDAPPTAHGNMSWITSTETPEEYISLANVRRWDYKVNPKDSGAHWRYLAVDVPASIHADLAESIPRAKALAQSSEIKILEFDRYGMDFIRNVAKFSPDSYVQMAMQLAYYRLYHRCTPTYETQTTRLFRDGRTETGRVLSVESVKWVQAMQDAKLGPTQKFEALRTAIITHVKYMLEAGQGKGIDRHFLGLRFCLREGEPIPALFKDAAFLKSQDYKLSTSNMTPGIFWEGGFGAYLQTGYGCCYGIRPHMIWVSISSRTTCPETSSEKFRGYLRDALIDIRQMIVDAIQQNPAITNTVPNLKKAARL